MHISQTDNTFLHYKSTISPNIKMELLWQLPHTSKTVYVCVCVCIYIYIYIYINNTSSLQKNILYQQKFIKFLIYV